MSCIRHYLLIHLHAGLVDARDEVRSLSYRVTVATSPRAIRLIAVGDVVLVDAVVKVIAGRDNVHFVLELGILENCDARADKTKWMWGVQIGCKVQILCYRISFSGLPNVSPT